jgi:hypothetical protein
MADHVMKPEGEMKAAMTDYELHAEWLFFGAAAIVGGLTLAYLYGQRMQVSYEDRVQQTIATDDREFCETVGAHVGTPQFVTCAKGLIVIRQRQADRDRAAQDFF